MGQLILLYLKKISLAPTGTTTTLQNTTRCTVVSWCSGTAHPDLLARKVPMLLSVNVLANDNVLIYNTVLYVVFFLLTNVKRTRAVG